MSQEIVRSFSNASFSRAAFISVSERKAMSSDFFAFPIVRHCKTKIKNFIAFFCKNPLDYCIILLYNVIHNDSKRRSR